MNKEKNEVELIEKIATAKRTSISLLPFAYSIMVQTFKNGN